MVLSREIHQSCPRYQPSSKLGFRYHKTITGGIKQNVTCDYNLIIFLLAGKLTVRCGFADEMTLINNEMCFIPIGECFDICYDANIILITCSFERINDTCNKFIFETYEEDFPYVEYRFDKYSIRPCLREYLSLLSIYVSDKLWCQHLQDLKKEELFIILRCYYTKLEIYRFLQPILGREIDFKLMILNNYQRVSTVAELIALSNMSKSLFCAFFKRHFGISAKQWMIERKKERMKRSVFNPNISVKEFAQMFDFSSPEHLYTFCKKHFDCTPMAFIKKYQDKGV